MKGRKKVLGVERVVEFDPETGMLETEGASISGNVLNLAIRLSRSVSGQRPERSKAQIIKEVNAPLPMWATELRGGQEPPQGGYIAEEDKWSQSSPSSVTLPRRQAAK